MIYKKRMRIQTKQGCCIMLYATFWSLVFTYVIFSYDSWSFFNRLGGVVWAKIGPEIVSILSYLLVSLLLLKKNKVSFNLLRFKGHFLPIAAIFVITFITRLQEFKIYFFKEDIFNYFSRDNVLYNFGPWISSHPAFITELVRHFSGYDPFLYQATLLVSHAIFSISVYILAIYFSKNKTIAFLSGTFFSITTLHFEEFNWLLHPLNYGWQALVMSFSVIALVWQIKKDPKGIPLISALLMMAAVGSGMAKTGPFFLILSAIDATITFPRFSFGGTGTWLKWFIKRQLAIWSIIFTFLLTRGLLTTSGSSRAEVASVPYYKIFLWLLGSYTTPPELKRFLIENFTVNFPEFIIALAGGIAGFLGVILVVLLLTAFIIACCRRKRLPAVIEVGSIWLLAYSLFFTFFGPHMLRNSHQLMYEIDLPHAAYPPVVGTSLLYGFLLYYLLKRTQSLFFKRLGIKTAMSLSWVLPTALFILMAFSLNNFYREWLGIAKGAMVTNQQFFFEAHMKFIPQDKQLVNIYYDDTARKRLDKYKPDWRYLKGFWNNSEVNSFSGEQELTTALKRWQQKGTLRENVDGLYYIYTDYASGIAQNLSLDLRSQILGRQQVVKSWEVIWGEEKNGWFVPMLSKSEMSKTPYYLPVVIVSEQFEYPSMLAPRVDFKLSISPLQAAFKPDLRADIASGLLVYGGLIETGDLNNAAERVISKPDESKSLKFTKTLGMGTVVDKIFNSGEVTKENGLWILVVGFSGDNINFRPAGNKVSLHDFFYGKYNAAEWGLVYMPMDVNSKSFSFKLPPSGRFLHKLLIMPLTVGPVAIKMSDMTIFNSNLPSENNLQD